jgi:hypothetical protein
VITFASGGGNEVVPPESKNRGEDVGTAVSSDIEGVADECGRGNGDVGNGEGLLDGRSFFKVFEQG